MFTWLCEASVRKTGPFVLAGIMSSRAFVKSLKISVRASLGIARN